MAQVAPATANLVEVTPLTAADIAFDLRTDAAHNDKGDTAAFAVIAKEFARNPRPHVRARYAEYLIGGKAWGAPDDDGRAVGLGLAQESLRQGSLFALRVLGLQLLSGQALPADPEVGLGYLQQIASTGNLDGICALGDVYFHGIGVRPNPVAAEIWYRRAGNSGRPHRLFRLGTAYEEGRIGQAPNLAKACALYYEAGVRGSRSADKRLDELAAKGEPLAQRARKLIVLWYAARGADYQTKQVREAMAYLETHCAEDPEVLLARGRVQRSGEFGFRDMEKAYALFDEAARRGSTDARSERARMRAEGYGTTKDEAAALAEWRALESTNHAESLAALGFFHYWGARGTGLLPKDPQLAYSYSKRAADLGNFSGQLNVAYCYEHGIGVKTDYALAAYYYRAAAWRGSLVARDKLPRLLAHVK